MRTMLTTTDNPYNPFTHYVEWNAFDMAKGYNSASYLSRVVEASPLLPEMGEDFATERAIDKIVELNFLGIYEKVQDTSIPGEISFVKEYEADKLTEESERRSKNKQEIE